MNSDSDEFLGLAQDEANHQVENCVEEPLEFAKVSGTSLACIARVEREGLPVIGNFRPIVRSDLALQNTVIKNEKWPVVVFSLVAWDTFSKAFRKLPRTRQIMYSKLTNRLLQTNSRNQRFYGTTGQCPGCGHPEETLAHDFTCPSEESSKAREESLGLYRESLENLAAPEAIIHHIMHGLTTWSKVEQVLLKKQIAPSIDGITAPPLTQAYNEQTRKIGWEAFLRGCIGLSWGEAYKAHYTDGNEEEAQCWLGDLIRATLDLSISLWYRQNGMIYGINYTEARNKELQMLHQKVTKEYESYEEDPFIILQAQSHLFDQKSIPQRLRQDRDNLACWLADVEEAKQVQRDF